jgi:hypothetical protein
MKKWLDCKEIHEVCFVIDRFVQALQCPIEIPHPDCSETFCQRSDVLPPREFM